MNEPTLLTVDVLKYGRGNRKEPGQSILQLPVQLSDDPAQNSQDKDVGQEGFHGDVPAAPAPERHHEG